MLSMNINELYIGQEFKNYKELCLTLDMAIKSGSGSKKAQLKELECYCKLGQDGRKFIIEEIYDEPKQKEDNRGKSEGSRRYIYGNLIQLLITDLLARCNGEISISRGWLLRTIGMTNVNYNYCWANLSKFSKHVNMNENIIYDFYNSSNNNFKSAIESALKRLMDKRVIMYNTIIKVVENEGYSHPRTATSLELKIIMTCETDILNQLGFEKISDVRTSKHWKLFKQKVSQYLNKETNIKFYYTAYDITINEDYIEQEKDALLKLVLGDVKREETMDELNNTVIEHVIVNAKNRQEEAMKFTSDKYKKYRTNENYLDDIEKLSKLLIDKNTYDFTFNVKDIKIDDFGTPYTFDINDELDDLFS